MKILNRLKQRTRHSVHCDSILLTGKFQAKDMRTLSKINKLAWTWIEIYGNYGTMKKIFKAFLDELRMQKKIAERV